MPNCEFKKGIFIQRVCGNPAYHQCKSCHMNVCSTHSMPIEKNANDVLCHNCYINAHELDESQARSQYLKSNSNHALWYSTYRNDHIESRSHLLFDESDYEEFDMRDRNENVYLSDEPDFFDS